MLDVRASGADARARLNVASIGATGLSGAYDGRLEHALMATAIAAVAAFHSVDMIRLLIIDTWNASARIAD